MIALFWDKQGGGFYFTEESRPILVRSKAPFDSAVPSGNSEAAVSLLALGRATGKQEYLDRAYATMEAFAGQMRDSPGSFPRMLAAVDQYLHPMPEPEQEVQPPPKSTVGTPLLADFLANLGSTAAPSTDSADLVQAEPLVSIDTWFPVRPFAWP
jgi:uncharacterized protein YyaL (SSP411 family)